MTQIGETNSNAKLTIDKVKEIKQLLSIGKSTTQIAVKYNVTKYCINNIKYNRTWKDAN